MPISKKLHHRSESAGFTLIEIMIVVAIIAILAGIGIPSYSDYVLRGQVAEAFAQLSDYRAKMEQYYLDNRNYGTADKCAADETAKPWNTFSPATQYFTFSCATSNSQQGFTVTATGSSGRAVGMVYTIDHNGARKTTKYKGNSSSAECWLAKSSSC